MAVWYETEDWAGVTRGRSYDFLATDEEVLEVLQTSLPVKYAPFTIIGYKNVKESDHYRHIIAESGIGDFPSLRDQDFVLFFVRSQLISQGMDLSSLRFVDSFLFVNGLIRLHHGSRTNKLGWTPSNIGMVNKIANRFTGQPVTHHDYEKVFFALRRSMKKQVRYRTLRVRPDGEEIEEKHIHMTEGFVAALRSGEIKSAYYPGDPL